MLFELPPMAHWLSENAMLLITIAGWIVTGLIYFIRQDANAKQNAKRLDEIETMLANFNEHFQKHVQDTDRHVNLEAMKSIKDSIEKIEHRLDKNLTAMADKFDKLLEAVYARK